MENKAYRLGTHRTLTPTDTLNQVQPLLKQMGISRTANITGLDRVGIPTYTAFRPQSRSISVSQGKGSTLEAAKVSAIMESVETYHAENISHPLRYASTHQLKDKIPLANTKLLARSGRKKLNPSEPIYWIEGLNLLSEQACWVPYEIVSTDYTLPGHKGAGHFAANTNGLASGNTFKEACCHAITEVVERDAEALWNQCALHAQAATSVDPTSIADRNCRWLMEKFKAARIKVKIWDMTSDLDLPAFICLAMGDEHDWADPEFGAGCHPSKEIALARALTEAAQARTTFIAGSRDDIGWSEYQPKKRLKRRLQGQVQLQNHRPEKQFDQLISYEFDTIEDDLAQCLTQLRAIGVQQVIAVDLSQPDLGLAVVKVVIPGLEGAYGHWHSDYVPGPRAKALLDLPFDILGQ